MSAKLRACALLKYYIENRIMVRHVNEVELYTWGTQTLGSEIHVGAEYHLSIYLFLKI